MIKRNILDKIKDKTDRILLSKTLDLADKYQMTGISCSTEFLNEYEYTFLFRYLNYLNIKYNSFSVNEDCSKKIIYFGDYSDFVTFYLIHGNFSHQDVLGTLFSIGYQYSMIGDIFCHDGKCYLTNLTKYNSILEHELVSIRNQKVGLEKIDAFIIDYPLFTELEIIVASLRLDLIIAKICNLSRSKALDLLKSSSVLINYKEMKDSSYTVRESDILSIRGYGKFVIGKEKLKTKSGNILLLIKQYC